MSSQDPKNSRCDHQQPYNLFYCCNYWWADVSTMSMALFWWSQKFMYFFFFFYFRFVIDNAKLTWRVEEKHLLHFVIVEVTQNILFYELDVLYIFDTNKVCPGEIYEFIWFLIWQTSTICKAHWDDIGIFTWQWYYFEYVGDSETLKKFF